jgi:hypothetical protein
MATTEQETDMGLTRQGLEALDTAGKRKTP